MESITNSKCEQDILCHLFQCFLQTRWSLIIQLKLLLHSDDPSFTLLESVLMADMFLQFPVKALVDLLNKEREKCLK